MTTFTKWRGITDNSEYGIPDSAVAQYDPADFTTSVWPDDIGDTDIDTISGLTFDSTAFKDSGGVYGDGSGDYSESSGFGGFGSTIDEGFAISVPFESSGGENSAIFAASSGTGTLVLSFLDGVDYTGNMNTFSFRVQDEDSNDIRMDTDSTYNDGNPHHCIFNVTGNTGSDIDIYIDDMDTPVSVNVNKNGTISNPADFDTVAYFNDNADQTMEGFLGKITWFDAPLDADERATVHDNIGWS